MKGNNGNGNIQERDLWQTDQELWKKLHYQYDFKIDCCANNDNSKCEIYFDNFQKIKEVKLMSWMNPPFSKARQMFEHFFKVVDKGVAIYRCDNLETSIWQDIILKNASWVLIPKGRWSYNFFEYTRGEIKNKGSRFPSALIGFNVETPKLVEGTILYIKKSLVEELNNQAKEYKKRNNLKEVKKQELVYRCPEEDCQLYVQYIGKDLFKCKRCGILINPVISYENVTKLVKDE